MKFSGWVSMAGLASSVAASAKSVVDGAGLDRMMEALPITGVMTPNMTMSEIATMFYSGSIYNCTDGYWYVVSGGDNYVQLSIGDEVFAAYSLFYPEAMSLETILLEELQDNGFCLSEDYENLILEEFIKDGLTDE